MGHCGTCPLEFANARKFCRPNARWLSLLDDFVTTNFGTRAPRVRAPLPEQNSGVVNVINNRSLLIGNYEGGSKTE